MHALASSPAFWILAIAALCHRPAVLLVPGHRGAPGVFSREGAGVLGLDQHLGCPEPVTLGGIKCAYLDIAAR